MSTNRPIRPNEIDSEKITSFPPEVFDSFNELIVDNFSEGVSVVKQDDVVKRMVAKGLNRHEIFEKGWLDVEDVYRKEGWRVTYDKPAYNEDYDAIFQFKSK